MQSVARYRLSCFFVSEKRREILKYINAKNILPISLLKELQKYVHGELVYIPKKGMIRAGWGERNGTRKRYIKRNNDIILLYRKGSSISEISGKYHLSEDSIRKITKGKKLSKHKN